MLPAQKCLGPHDLAGAQVDLRLVQQPQFATCRDAVQRALDVESAFRLGLDVGRVQLCSVATELLGPVHRAVGAAQQRVRFAAVLRRVGDADAA